MARLGLVGHVEQEIERMISQGMLPEDGFLPAEHSLAKRYGVSRTTVREALRLLVARGLVEQHPGRRSRAVALDEAVTLESLSVALPSEGPMSSQGQRLLEGYLALKRDTAVEVLAACCEHASDRDLDRLQEVCFALVEAARWEPGSRQAALEFELLRLAARAADLPGQALLLQSLQRAFQGMAGRLVPLLDAESTRQWALRAFHALGEKDAQGLRHELPGLLRAADERLLSGLKPVP